MYTERNGNNTNLCLFWHFKMNMFKIWQYSSTTIERLSFSYNRKRIDFIFRILNMKLKMLKTIKNICEKNLRFINTF